MDAFVASSDAAIANDSIADRVDDRPTDARDGSAMDDGDASPRDGGDATVDASPIAPSAELIFESVVPTEEVVETRNGTRKTVTRTRMPGYVLVRMDLTDESWSAVRHTPSVTGFVAHANAPVPLSLQEVEDQLAPAALAAAAAASNGPKKRTRKVEVADFKVGDSVMVVNGPFSGVHATITEINANSQRLKALVEILGRETPVDLTFNQIAKV